METCRSCRVRQLVCQVSSPFGGIPRNWKHSSRTASASFIKASSPFGGIPRNWKLLLQRKLGDLPRWSVPPSGGSLEIGNKGSHSITHPTFICSSPFGGIPRNWKLLYTHSPLMHLLDVPPSGGSLEIGNNQHPGLFLGVVYRSPFGGIPRNWKL